MKRNAEMPPRFPDISMGAASGNITLTDDERTVLLELNYCHRNKEYPQDWVRGRDLSGPMGSTKVKAFRGLLRKGLIVRKQDSTTLMRQRCVWRVSASGFAWVDSRILDGTVKRQTEVLHVR